MCARSSLVLIHLFPSIRPPSPSLLMRWPFLSLSKALSTRALFPAAPFAVLPLHATSSLFLAAPSASSLSPALPPSMWRKFFSIRGSEPGAGTAWRRVPRARPSARHRRSGTSRAAEQGPCMGRTGRRCALRGAAARGNILGEAVKASGHQRTRKAWELTAAPEIWLQMLLILGVRQIGS